MSEYTMERHDVEPEKRTWQGGYFCVKKGSKSIGLFLFDYPESTSHLHCDEAEALAAANAFMAIDDLVAALKRIVASDDAHQNIHAEDGDNVSRMIEYSAAFDNARSILDALDSK